MVLLHDIDHYSDQLFCYFQDKTVRLWNIEDAEMIPMVMEKKKAIGMKVFKAREWSIIARGLYRKIYHYDGVVSSAMAKCLRSNRGRPIV